MRTSLTLSLVALSLSLAGCGKDQDESQALSQESHELSSEALTAGEQYEGHTAELFQGVDTASLDGTAPEDLDRESAISEVAKKKSAEKPAEKSASKAVFPIKGGAHFIAGLGVGRSRTNEYGQVYSTGHKGVDWGAKMGTPVVAVWGGRVVYSSVDSLGGNVVKIMHPSGKTTYYAHLRSHSALRAGQIVKAGQLVGYVGMTGNAKGTVPHLHFELRAHGNVLNPLTNGLPKNPPKRG
jgi:murein DD-endopeptidase MepM/ murein hydrolase activator NlpD